MIEAEDANGKIVPLEMISQEPTPYVKPLKCRYCPRPVKAVGGYYKPRKNGGTPYWVSSYFALLGHPDHGPRCPLNPVLVIEEIAKGSEGLAEARPDGGLRLVLPDELDAATLPKNTEPCVPSGPPDAPVELRITTTHPHLPPGLNSAAKIAQFLQLNAFSPKALGLFSVTYRGTVIPWRNFCYGPPAYARLHQRVHRSGTPLPHPVAVYGTVVSSGVKNGKAYTVLARKVPPATDEEPPFDVLLRSDYPSLTAPLRPGTHVLAVGHRWKIRSDAPEVQLWVTAHWQLALWTRDPETGLPSDASCPPPLTTAQRALAQARRQQRGRTPSRGGTPPPVGKQHDATAQRQPDNSNANDQPPRTDLPASRPDTVSGCDPSPQHQQPNSTAEPADQLHQEPGDGDAPPKSCEPADQKAVHGQPATDRCDPPPAQPPAIPPPPTHPPYVPSSEPERRGILGWFSRRRA
jgi:hypothetical protein